MLTLATIVALLISLCHGIEDVAPTTNAASITVNTAREAKGDSNTDTGSLGTSSTSRPVEDSKITFAFDENANSRLVGFFDLMQDPACGGFPSSLGLEDEADDAEAAKQLADAAKWTLGRMRMQQQQQRKKAGLSDTDEAPKTTDILAVDTCGNATYTIRKILSYAAKESLFLEQDSERKGLGSCDQNRSRFNGFLLFSSIAFSDLTSLSAPLLSPTFLPRPLLTLAPTARVDVNALKAALSLMKRLRWQHAVVVADDEDTAGLFGEMATQEDVCVVDQYVLGISNTARSGTMTIGPAEFIRSIRTTNIFVMAESKRYTKHFLASLPKVSEQDLGKNWIVITPAGTGRNIDSTYKDRGMVYTIEKSYLQTPEFTLANSNVSSSSSPRPTEDPRIFGVMKSVVEVASWTSTHPKECPPPTSASFPRLTDAEVHKILDTSAEPVRYEIYANATLVGTFTAEEKLTFSSAENAAFVTELAHFHDLCEDCRCRNDLPVLSLTTPQLRLETPMTVMLTIAAAGVLFSVAFILYLSCKAWSEVVDGSQSFSIFILFVFIAMFALLLAFAFSPDKSVCIVRMHGTSIVYATLFGALLARSLMLATADSDGLPGHVSGLVQIFIFTTLAGLQVALAVQEWQLRERPYTETVVVGRRQVVMCRDVGTDFVWRMTYVMVLLGMQLVISPFIISSRRNYREGLQFCLGSVGCLLVWIAWIIFYSLFAHEFSRSSFDIAVCAGILATPIVLMLTVFVPKCYLIATPSYPAAKSNLRSRELTLSLQKIAEMEQRPAGSSAGAGAGTRGSSSSSEMEEIGAGGTGRGGGSGNYNVRIQGMTTTSSTTDPNNGIFDSNNTLSEYLNHTNDIYDSLRDQPVLGVPQFNNQPRSRQTPSFHGMDNSEYPTYKLDRNTVVDTSMKWERYVYPGGPSVTSSSASLHGGVVGAGGGGRGGGGSQQQLPPPPPLPKPYHDGRPNEIGRRGTRL